MYIKFIDRSGRSLVIRFNQFNTACKNFYFYNTWKTFLIDSFKGSHTQKQTKPDGFFFV